jgi:tetratricopeptide (TPR) repeat protein
MLFAGLWLLPLGQLAAAPNAGRPPGAVVDPAAPLRLDVLIVNDPDFPAVTEADARAILAEAKLTLADKLAFPELLFRVVGAMSVTDFLRRADVQESCLAEYADYQVHPTGRQPREVDKSFVLLFLKRWDLEALRAFFPEPMRVGLTTYDDVYEALMTAFTEKLQLIASFSLPSGKSLLTPESMRQRSYVHWLCVMRNQDLADLVLTNAFILYDLGTEPYPHSIFQKNKVGGASVLSLRRTAIGERAMFASTFSMVTNLDFFREPGADTLTPAERLAVVGNFIVAHELGHALFKLPDFYDHPPQCLMTTKFETGYVSGYHDLKRFPGSCPKCQPWVDAKRHVFRAQAALRAGNREEAVKALKLAIAGTPKQIDGNYIRYIATLTVQIAELYAEMGDPRQARRWVRSALRVAPKLERGLTLDAKLGPE